MAKHILPLFLLVLSFAASAETAETPMPDGDSAQLHPLSFATLERTGRPNDFLAAPEGFAGGKPDLVSPVYAVSAEALLEIAREVLSEQPRTELLASFAAERQLALEQRSALFGFRDSIWLQAVENENGSSLLIYSRSNVGYWDIGANRGRVESWLGAIGKAVEAK